MLKTTRVYFGVLHIACALRWGVALVGDFLCWALLTPSWKFFFRYWRYTGRRNRCKRLVEKKARFGFVLYLVNFGYKNPVFVYVKRTEL